MRKLLAAALLSVMVLIGWAHIAFADTITLPNPLCPRPGSPECIDSFPKLIEKITEYITNIIGGLAIIVFIWAGILFLTSRGNPEQIGKAKKAVWYATIGLAIALAARGLVMVVTAVIGSNPP